MAGNATDPNYYMDLVDLYFCRKGRSGAAQIRSSGSPSRRNSWRLTLLSAATDSRPCPVQRSGMSWIGQSSSRICNGLATTGAKVTDKWIHRLYNSSWYADHSSGPSMTWLDAISVSVEQAYGSTTNTVCVVSCLTWPADLSIRKTGVWTGKAINPVNGEIPIWSCRLCSCELWNRCRAGCASPDQRDWELADLLPIRSARAEMGRSCLYEDGPRICDFLGGRTKKKDAKIVPGRKSKLSRGQEGYLPSSATGLVNVTGWANPNHSLGRWDFTAALESELPLPASHSNRYWSTKPRRVKMVNYHATRLFKPALLRYIDPRATEKLADEESPQWC